MSTGGKEYADRLKLIQRRRWKRWLDVQRPYRWNLQRLNPGITLDIGCGIGRSLASLSLGSVGIDHNPHAIAEVRAKGLVGFSPDEFLASSYCVPESYDSLLFGHVLEHMHAQEAGRLATEYLRYLKRHGQVIVFTPQEAGFRSDPTHVNFLDFEALRRMLDKAGLDTTLSYSFPFPRPMGRWFRYNEFVVVAVRRDPGT